tara:strand:+ start:1726 stop:1920 length:195 start_codon:yes stop_codon:yes gene_type:complete
VLAGFGKMRRMSQWMFCARRWAVEREVGRINQRMMRDTVRGLREVLDSVRRSCGMEEEGVRERT